MEYRLKCENLEDEKTQLEDRISKMKKNLNEVKQKFETQLQKEIEEKDKILTEQIGKIEALEKYISSIIFPIGRIRIILTR